MDPKDFAALCARINGALDVREYINLLGYHGDRAIKVGNLYRLFCPIHKDTVFRSLVINPRRNTYHCEHTACPGHSPGDLIDLLAKARGVPLTASCMELIAHFGHEALHVSAKHVEALRQHLDAVRADEQAKNGG